MPTRHVSIQDSTTTLPANDGATDVVKTFDAPGLGRGTRPFMMYRVTPSDGHVSLRIVLNAATIVNQEFNSTAGRSMHEIFDEGVLQERGNDLVIIRQAGPGTVQVSDLVVVYPA